MEVTITAEAEELLVIVPCRLGQIILAELGCQEGETKLTGI